MFSPNSGPSERPESGWGFLGILYGSQISSHRSWRSLLMNERGDLVKNGSPVGTRLTTATFNRGHGTKNVPRGRIR